jgi:hypothetical protein
MDSNPRKPPSRIRELKCINITEIGYLGESYLVKECLVLLLVGA